MRFKIIAHASTFIFIAPKNSFTTEKTSLSSSRTQMPILKPEPRSSKVIKMPQKRRLTAQERKINFALFVTGTLQSTITRYLVEIFKAMFVCVKHQKT